jgi:hypothetical protein
LPYGGAYHGIKGEKRYLAEITGRSAQAIREPEQFVPAGDRVIVFVQARVLPRGTPEWQDIKFVDLYTFSRWQSHKKRPFASRKHGLQWVGHDNPNQDFYSGPTAPSAWQK